MAVEATHVLYRSGAPSKALGPAISFRRFNRQIPGIAFRFFPVQAFGKRRVAHNSIIDHPMGVSEGLQRDKASDLHNN